MFSSTVFWYQKQSKKNFPVEKISYHPHNNVFNIKYIKNIKNTKITYNKLIYETLPKKTC